ncbi:MAG: BON domain-containing protein [Alphaproteobacteria bacterium]
MRKSRLAIALAVVGLLAGTVPACSGSETSESTGEYIDDSVISNTVRAKLVDDKDLNFTQIDVTTYKGVVQLSGFVDTAAKKAKATQVASSVDGVKQVRNDLVVKN